MTVDQGSDFFDKKTKYKIIMLGKRIVDETTGTISGRVEKEIGLANYISGSAKQSKLKIFKLNTNLSNLKADGSIIIRPVFEKLPSINQVLKNRIKKIKNKNKKLKTCPICQDSKLRFFVKKYEFEMDKCESCGLIFCNPYPSKQQIYHYYNSEMKKFENDFFIESFENRLSIF